MLQNSTEKYVVSILFSCLTLLHDIHSSNCLSQNYFTQFKDYDITSIFVQTTAAQKINFVLPQNNISALDLIENKSAVSDYKINLSGNTRITKWVVLEIQLIQDSLMDYLSIIHPLNYSTAMQSQY